MTRSSTKEFERRVAERYLLVRQIQGEIVDDQREAPDIEVSTADGRLGVEVTIYHSHGDGKNPLREVEAAWEKLQEQVKMRRNEHAGFALHFAFKKKEVPPSKDRAQFIEDAISLSKTLPASNQTFVTVDDLRGYPVLQSYVSSVRFQRTKYQGMLWGANFSGGRIGTSDNEMMEAIGNKLAQYEQPEGFARSVLVVAAATGYFSTIAGIMHEDHLNEYGVLNAALDGSQFDEVFVMEFSNWIWERGAGWRPYKVEQPE
jgi:hypothetical protein